MAKKKETAPTMELTKVDHFRNQINSEHIQSILSSTLKESAASFTASMVDIYNSDSLKDLDPALVINEALKAASLKLPISKGLGFAYIIPFKGKPQFQIGYRGYLQLAIRSGLYETINADVVYEGELTGQDKLKGTFTFGGQKKSEKVIGYFAHTTLKNGFSKTLYMTREQVEKHAARYSASYNSTSSPWKSHFDEMGIKTVLKNLINHYGSLSIEMQNAFENDADEEIKTNANTQDMGFTPYQDVTEKNDSKQTTEAKQDPPPQQSQQSQQTQQSTGRKPAF